MDRVKLISTCRYYSGEEKCPFKTDELALYWDLERSYVDNSRGVINAEQDALYRSIKGRDYKGIPRALLIWMFTAYMKQSYNVKDSLPFFYAFIDGYLNVASDYFPEDEIPHNIRR